MSQSARCWCFTINNYTDDDTDVVLSWKRITNLLVCSKEVGESGTPHLQGVARFKHTYRMPALKRLHARAHWEICRNPHRSVEYCKKDGDILIDHNGSEQGKRTDLADLRQALDDGGMEKAKEVCPETLIKYASGSRIYCSIAVKPPSRYPTRSMVFYGLPGTGKTRAASTYTPFFSKSASNKWFDGYGGEPVLLIDELNPTTLAIPNDTMLQILDPAGLPLMVECKGTSVPAKWRTVIITTNYHPSTWYVTCADRYDALLRRIELVDKPPYPEHIAQD